MLGTFDPLLGLEFPAVLGLEEIQRIRLTRPPYRCYGEGRLLVVAVRRPETGAELVLAYERYPRAPRPEKVERAAVAKPEVTA